MLRLPCAISLNEWSRPGETELDVANIVGQANQWSVCHARLSGSVDRYWFAELQYRLAYRTRA